jgi:ankyrin repeat protein
MADINRSEFSMTGEIVLSIQECLWKQRAECRRTVRIRDSSKDSAFTRILGKLVNAQGGTYKNALYAASSFGHKEVVQLLLENGADVNAKDGNALYIASCWGHEEVVQLLLANGADIIAQGGEHSNALEVALSWGHTVVVKLLEEHGGC